ncbi:hypothetical protein BCR32DRAFT_273487 [Anaeromyces robustus]|uniref:Uncharacterized protein n=1 Tax=Anaeromyces robustus TaxID=1754192 RepID=A0A1Y1VPN0_9FUNG|nr:hypothetical protein BCR32DRAFT_273487 [Anaeromyces robustus]|eukprot:ORX63262.1 hypothetical protein BCR32DRAFT_273487 [Anaeromyces robustus]
MLTEKELLLLEPQRHLFIENDRSKASSIDWLTKRGTNFECYKKYLESLDTEARYNNKIEHARILFYTIFRPLQNFFFYWTLIILIFHKFNYKNPIVKIILAHFILRALGDIFDKAGGFMQRYYANAYSNDLRLDFECINTFSFETQHPLKWFITRQVATIFWYSGEIFGDWYPLLRTKAALKNKKAKALLPVYITCGLFNLSKIILIIHHLTLTPTKLYDENGVFKMESRDKFYAYHWLFQFMIICTSILYDVSVFYVLKKNIFNNNTNGFIKNFKTISEYRIFITAYISVILLPFVAIAIILKYYYMITQRMNHIEFSYEDIRLSIANLQYHMIFIDQVLLFYYNTKEDDTHEFSIVPNLIGKAKTSMATSNRKLITSTLNPSLNLGLSPGLSPGISPGLSPALSPALSPDLSPMQNYNLSNITMTSNLIKLD